MQTAHVPAAVRVYVKAGFKAKEDADFVPPPDRPDLEVMRILELTVG